ncbi:hypothetical protein [Dictyobacter aurantiacus]|uniref:Uncharacterized protein n=1 Tax=Dictyobacter aurantiacus TaxID=1936993 RepID=A0A401ZME2_9CHLR|nr:hypothetical protein [Dictyobacter aurantiacus]GCE07936.1 hypothetical protein KDAU_52650 [Dictyobacter aurantiacus]
MNDIDDTEAIEHLRQAGWTPVEIERLRQVRRAYVEKGEQTLGDHPHSTFVRWLLILLQEGVPASGPCW